MKSVNLDLFNKISRYMLIISAISPILMYLMIVIGRIHYPFDLEWIEGGSVTNVQQILMGNKIYIQPSLNFIPFIYTPLYYYISAVAAGLFGLGYIPLRAVSFLASLGCFVIIYLIVKKETASNFSGMLATGLFAATYKITGTWFDIARVDSLFLLFLLLSIYFIKFANGIRSYLISGIFLCLSFYTKQTALLIYLPLLLYCKSNKRSLVVLTSMIIILIGGGILFLDYIHDNWFSYYTFFLPGHHQIEKKLIINFWTKDLLAHLAIACSMSLFYLIMQLNNADKKNLVFYSLLAAGMLGGAWASRLHTGGYNNVLLPAYAAIAILFGMAFHTVKDYAHRFEPIREKLLVTSIYLTCIIQFFCLCYNPFSYIPKKVDLESGRVVLNIIKKIQGNIFIPPSNFLPHLVGKNTFAHGCAIHDVLRADSGPVKEKLLNELAQAIQEKKFAAIFIEREWPEGSDGIIITDYYTKFPIYYPTKHAFQPVVGCKYRPDYIYLPKP